MSCILSLKLDWSCVWKFAQSSTKMLKPFHAWCWQYKIRLSALFSYHEIKGRVDNTKLHLLLPICPINHTFSKIPSVETILYNFFNLNNLWYFNHFLDNFFNWYFNFFYSINISNNLDNLFFDIFDWFWYINIVVYNFLNLNNFRLFNNDWIS